MVARSPETRSLARCDMQNPSLRDLPFFPSAYVGFVAGAPSPGRASPDLPEKDLLISRCKAVLREMRLYAALPEILRQEASSIAGERSWSENLATLEQGTAVVVAAAVDAGGFGRSLVPLLKCLTAIKLAGELSRAGTPAVPLLWSSGLRQTEDSTANSSGEAGRPARDFIDYFNKYAESPSLNDLYLESARRILVLLAREFGLISVDSASFARRLADCVDLEGLRRKVTGSRTRESKTLPALDGAGGDPNASGRDMAGLSWELLLRLSLPVAAEITGPEEFNETAVLSDLVDAAGMPQPFLWPRVSATIVDQRSRRTMGKFGLGLPDLLQGSSTLLQRMELDRHASEVSNRLEALAGNIRVRIAGISARASGDPRTVRKVRASGSRMLYQLRKLAVRSRQAADARHDIAARQLEELLSRIVPGGELQERRLSAAQLLSTHPESTLRALYSMIDVWDLNHQLIGLD
jgi:hypothetical protein